LKPPAGTYFGAHEGESPAYLRGIETFPGRAVGFPSLPSPAYLRGIET